MDAADLWPAPSRWSPLRQVRSASRPGPQHGGGTRREPVYGTSAAAVAVCLARDQPGGLAARATARTRLPRLAQEINDQRGIVHALQYLGECELLGDDIGAAERHCSRAVYLAREMNEDHLLATTLVRHAQVLDARAEPGEARAALAEAIAISDRVGEKWCRGYALWNLALLLQATGHSDEGLRSARAVLDSKALFHNVVGVAQGLEAMAWCSADLADARRAAVLLGAADEVWTSSGAVLPLGSCRDEWSARDEPQPNSARRPISCSGEKDRPSHQMTPSPGPVSQATGTRRSRVAPG